MAEAPNLRAFTRVKLERRAAVLVEHRSLFLAEITDMSMSGLFLKSQEPLEIGTECRISVPLSEGGEIRIEARAIVVRATSEGFAVHFTSLVGMESYEHLRSLLLYNARDPESLETEFKTHPGIL